MVRVHLLTTVLFSVGLNRGPTLSVSFRRDSGGSWSILSSVSVSGSEISHRGNNVRPRTPMISTKLLVTTRPLHFVVISTVVSVLCGKYSQVYYVSILY